MSRSTFPGIPDPQPTLESLLDVSRVLKESVEILRGLRGDERSRAVLAGELDDTAFDWSQVVNPPTSFVPAAHTHSVTDVTGLQALLDDKANINHTHAAEDIVSGQLDPARISAPAIQQHQSQLTISASQIPDLAAFLPPVPQLFAGDLQDVAAGPYVDRQLFFYDGSEDEFRPDSIQPEDISEEAVTQHRDATLMKVYPAGETIGGHRVVRVTAGEAFYADKGDGVLAEQIVGISQNAADESDDVRVQFAGEIEQGGWDWTPGGVVFLAEDGLLTQSVPTTDVLVVVGFAVTATRVYISLQRPIYLGD